ncbi:hypothetical protein [uncultured Shewanella sp.]|uniref:hypothetical protein n=1 Tax=uncultured Shewanella sp. TaxID=173975 RepID=UPI0026221DEF|nr:hypothetical protein [uncultured Shewanella sp.]
MPTLSLTHPKVTISQDQLDTSKQTIQDVSLGKQRLTAFIRGDIDNVTQLGCFEKSFDRLFCDSKKDNAMNVINAMVELETTDESHSATQQVIAMEHNFKQLKDLAGEGNSNLFQVKRNQVESNTTFIVDGQIIAKVNAVCGGFENSQDLSDSGAWVAEELSW